MTDLAVRAAESHIVPEGEWRGLQMMVSPAEALRRVTEQQAFVSSVMKEGVDFGVIPGTKGKPSLWQPGAQKLAEMYALAIDFADVEVVADWNAPLFHFRKKALITSMHDGRFLGSGVGSCNSRESKYSGRWGYERDVPKGVDKSTLKSRTRTGDRGAYTQFFLPNPEPFDLVNTIEKMACKRAMIAAVLSVTRMGNVFTQDVEDIAPEAFGKPAAKRSWEQDSPPHDDDGVVLGPMNLTAEAGSPQVVAAIRAATEADIGAVVEWLKANRAEFHPDDAKLYKDELAARAARVKAAKATAKPEPAPADGPEEAAMRAALAKPLTDEEKAALAADQDADDTREP